MNVISAVPLCTITPDMTALKKKGIFFTRQTLVVGFSSCPLMLGVAQ